MELLDNLALGFQTALTFKNMAYALFGAMLGTLIGVLPGLGPVATIAMLLPSIYALDATPALIMLAREKKRLSNGPTSKSPIGIARPIAAKASPRSFALRP